MAAGMGVDGDWPFVARAAELERLAAAIEAGGGISIVHGGPGTGKTRLLEEAALAAERRGLAVIRIRSSALLHEVPLGALGGLLPDRGGLAVAAADPGRLFGVAIEALASFARGRRVLVVVDDAGLLDPASIGLVTQLAAAGEIALLVSASREHPLPDAFSALWDARSARVDLTPLDDEALGELLLAVLGARVAHRTVPHLAEVSGGDLAYLREILRHAIESEALVLVEGGWRLAESPLPPPSLRDLVVARIRRLEPRQQELVERLSLCGAVPVAQLLGEGVPAALDALEQSGIVVAEPSEAGLVVRLTSAAVGSAVEATIGRLRRAAVLEEQAARAEAVGTSADRLRAAVWRVGAGGQVDPERLIGAVRLALDVGDHATVLHLTEVGLRGGSHPELRLRRAESLLRSGRADEAAQILDGLVDSAPIELVPAVGAVLAQARMYHRGGRAAALRALDAAQARVGHADRLLACARVQVLVVDEHPAGARAALREALAAAEDVVPGAARGDSQDPSGGGAAARETEELQVAVATAPALAALGRFDEALELAERAASFSDRAAQPVYGLRVTDTQAVLAEVLMLQMRDREARAAATRALVASIGDDEELAARGAEWVLARLSVYCDLEGALRWADDVRSGAAVFGPELLRHEATALLVHLHALRGDIVRAEALLAELEPHADEHRVGWGVARLLVQAARGDVSGAWPGLGRWADRMREQGHLGYAGGMLVMMLQFGPAADIAPRARALADAAPGPYFERLAAHAAAAADGDAPALLRIAHEWEEDGALLLAASAYGEAARAQQRGGAERAAARSQARAEELARRMGGLSTPVVRFADELTPLTRREREIANLAASGLSSKDIAARLFLSARTVDNHLQSVYGKLGITGRHELALG